MDMTWRGHSKPRFAYATKHHDARNPAAPRAQTSLPSLPVTTTVD